MDILTAIIPTIIEYTLAPVGRQVGYLIHYKSNLQNLRSQLTNLDAAKDRIKHRVEEVETKGKGVETDVQNWRREADKISEEAVTILEAKTNCFRGICPNLISYHQLSRKSSKLVKKIELHEKKEFTSVSYNAPIQDICAVASQEYMAFESRNLIVKKIMEEIRNPDTNMIGVYGFGGVGKTTLAKEVFREAAQEKLFNDVVIILNVKEKKDPEKIQKEIAEKLGMEVNETQSMEVRANCLWNRIKGKNTLIILDDVLERIDLDAVGLLHGRTCNILLTSRDKKVLFSKIRTQKNFMLDLLGEEETWSLFEKMAGDAVKDDRIREVATQVAKKCGGLPVLVVAVASALRGSGLEEWKDALRRFKSFDKKGLTETAFLALEWSYNQLDGEELKPLFLLCGIMAQDSYNISLNDLLKYTIGLGLFKYVHTVEEERNALHSLIKNLKDSCLLLDGYDDARVKMHDLVRDVAVQIASRDQHVLSRLNGDELEEWPSKECSLISLVKCTIPNLPQEPWVCPNLKFFLLESSDESLEIPYNFFEEMKELKVLDLTGIHFPSLPPSLKFLINLQALCLDVCVLVDIALLGQLINLKILSLIYSKFEQLPKEIGQLTRLRLLDLTGCSQLVLISPNVISRLTRLEDLRMGVNSFKQWDGEGVIGDRSNASILELRHLSQLTALDIHILDANMLPANLFSAKLERYTILVGDCWKYPNIYGTSSNMLKLKLVRIDQFDQGLKMLVKRCEHLYVDGMVGGHIVSYLSDNDSGKQLKHLHVQNNDEVTYVHNSMSQCYSGHAFPNLESLSLANLVNLECVCYGQLIAQPFPKLRSLELRNLPKLVGFSSKGSCRSIVTTEVQEIVWEDENGGPTKPFMTGEVVMPNLTSLILHECDGLRFMFSCSMARSLVQLKHLEISKCQNIEQIVAKDDCGLENANNMFGKLKHLQLQYLPRLTRFCSGSCIDEFPSLELLHLEDCTKLGTFIFDSKIKNVTNGKETEERDSKENLENDVRCFLLDEKIRFPSLETLIIHDQPKLMTVWHHQLAPNSFCKLNNVDVLRCRSLINIFEPSMMGRLNALYTLKIKQCKSLQVVFEVGGVRDVEATDATSTAQLNCFECPDLDFVKIDSCESLKSIFPVSVADGLPNLRQWSVENCGILEEIVAKEGLERTPVFVFPKLTCVWFEKLPQLRTFYPGLHVSKWPLLNILGLWKCGNVEVFASEFSRFQDELELGLHTPIKQPFFLIEKGNSFHDLEELGLDENTEIWNEAYGPFRAAELFGKLKVIHFGGPHPIGPKSVAFFQKLHNLEKLFVYGAHWKEIFVHEGNSNAVGTQLPHVKHLRLSSMEELLHLDVGNDNSQAVTDGPVFPCLEILEVYRCGILKNLTSSLISFQNLTTLDVYGCGGLKYLTTYSVAKCLQQLKKLEVGNCESMIEIVASNGDDDDSEDHEIAFSHLQHLKLESLTSLQGFCSSGNCVVKVPSLIDTLIVNNCPIKLRISPGGLLLCDSKPERITEEKGIRS